MAVVEHLGWVTGERSLNRTDQRWAVGGTDLGIMWDNGRGQVLAAFGDTFNPRKPESEGGGGGGGDWRNNVLAISTDWDLTNGMTIDSFLEDRPGHAKQFIGKNTFPGITQETTVIPTGACRVGDRQYLAYMSVRDWGAAGTWNTNYAGIAYSDDGGFNWVKGGTYWHNTSAGDQRFQMPTLLQHGGYVYIYGSPNGRRGKMYLARAPQGKLWDLSYHRQWDGSKWVNDQWKAIPIIDEEVSESHVVYHRHSRQFLMTYLADQQGRIVMHSAPSPVGPWSGPMTIVEGTEYPQLYGAFFHPWSLDDPNPVFLMSQWLQYNTRLMRLNLGQVGYQKTRVIDLKTPANPYNG